MALIEPRPPRLALLLAGLCALTFMVGAGFALFHVGVERHWWQSACAGGGTLAKSPAELLAQLQSGPQPVPCDAVTASLFGFSLASYNILASLALAAFSAYWARTVSRAK